MHALDPYPFLGIGKAKETLVTQCIISQGSPEKENQ